MMYSLAILQAQDYTKWKESYDSEESKAERKAIGEKSYQILRTVDDPNTFALLNEWEDAGKAKGFLKSDRLRELQRNSGIVGKPAMYIFGEVEKGTV